MALKGRNPVPLTVERLRYKTISRWSFTTVWLNWTNGLLRLINSMVTELIRPVNYNSGRSQKVIKLEISSCRCLQLECNEENDETLLFSVIMLALCGPLPQAYRVHAKRPVLCTHSGFKEEILTVSCHYPTPICIR